MAAVLKSIIGCLATIIMLGLNESVAQSLNAVNVFASVFPNLVKYILL